MRVLVVELMMIDDDHMIIVCGFPLNINMSSNNFITLTGVFASADVNNGIATTAVFSQSASNQGLVTNQCTFADTTFNRGLATGVAVFQGSASNDGTVEQAVFLGASRNVGTVTSSATFAETAQNAGMVHGDVVLVDASTNVGTIAGSVQLGASAVSTGTIFGVSSVHTQGDGAYAYGYYVGGVRDVPVDYSTRAYQIGDFWYTYDTAGFATLANGEYDDGTSALFVFVGGQKVAALEEGSADHPHQFGAYWADVNTLDVGVILYAGQYVNTRASNLSAVEYNGFEISTNILGTITHFNAIYHPYSFSSESLTIYANTSALEVGVIVYSGQQTNIPPAIVFNVQFFDGFIMTADAEGVITDFIINHLYSSVGDLYWTDSPQVILSGKWYTGQNVNTPAANLVNAEAYGFLFDTDDQGRVTSRSAISHTQCTQNYFGNTGQFIIVGTTILYIGANTMVVVPNLNYEDTQDGFTISTDANGLVTQYDPI